VRGTGKTSARVVVDVDTGGESLTLPREVTLVGPFS